MGKKPHIYNKNKGREMLEFVKAQTMNNNLPFAPDIADYLGCSVSALKYWRDHYPEFAEAWEEMKEITLAMLAKKGLTREYDASFTKFWLKAVYGLRETDEIRVGNAADQDGNAESFGLTVRVVGPDGTDL